MLHFLDVQFEVVVVGIDVGSSIDDRDDWFVFLVLLCVVYLQRVRAMAEGVQVGDVVSVLRTQFVIRLVS